MKQPRKTREAILKATGDAFSQRGYAGSGLSGILAAAGMTKGALFHHYPDKQTLAKAWIEDCLGPAMHQQWAVPLSEVNSLDALMKFCATRCSELESQDFCSTLVALTAEVAHSDETLGASLEVIFKEWRSVLAEVLERGQSDTWIHHSLDSL
jgi:TetR/AcrR family transcriptional repressor of nem operon